VNKVASKKKITITTIAITPTIPTTKTKKKVN
jgi:hypothetical protein